MDLLVVHHRIRNRTGKEFPLQPQLDAKRFATEGESKRVMFGFRLFGGSVLPPCLLASPLPAPCPLALSLLYTDDEHVGKGILVYSHLSQKKTGLTRFFDLLPVIPSYYYSKATRRSSLPPQPKTTETEFFEGG